MNVPSPEPPQLDPLRVIRGAATDVVLRDENVPGVHLDHARTPEERGDLLAHHLAAVVRPRVDAWMRQHMTDGTVEVAHGLVGRYNELLRLHPGRRIHAADFSISRPPIDPFEAMEHKVDIDPDAKRAVALADAAAVAEFGPVASLEYVRHAYVQLLAETRIALARLMPNENFHRADPHRQNMHRTGRSHLQILPLVYRNAEEFVALHMVDGKVADLRTPPAPQAPLIPETNHALRASQDEHRRYSNVIATLRQRALRVLDAYREYLRVDSGRSSLGRLVASASHWFPVQDCERLVSMLHKEQRLQQAQAIADELHAAWRQTLEFGAKPGPRAVHESYQAVSRSLQEFGNLVESLVTRVLDGYEGK